MDKVSVYRTPINKLGEIDPVFKDIDPERIRTKNLKETNLSHLDLKGMDLSRFDLSGANLSQADLFGAVLYQVNLGADLEGADVSWVDISESNLCKANLRYVDFSESDFTQSNLGRADLTGARLVDAGLKEANLKGACLDSCEWFDPEKNEIYVFFFTRITGPILTRLREQFHLSQKELGRRSGISQTTISLLENGYTQTIRSANEQTLLDFFSELSLQHT